ncbi:hypothetical protein A6R68_12017 [Neotoma lepida]|uniref:Uncharacterized protein n=1 Tax=Neotoma lepida TaxID=56216 RepID=A0A1A6H518_NEOLE|nr:hypothetical protein A6R68_12017 [Neotoma lepida]
MVDFHSSSEQYRTSVSETELSYCISSTQTFHTQGKKEQAGFDCETENRITVLQQDPRSRLFGEESSFQDGPLLRSSEIPLSMEDSISTQPTEFPFKPIQRCSSYWRITSIKEKSSLQMQTPISNAVLNEYLEQKVVELYKQYIMDTVFHDSSPTQILASELIMTNVDQISLQVSREKNLDTSKVKDIVISHLLQLVSRTP